MELVVFFGVCVVLYLYIRGVIKKRWLRRYLELGGVLVNFKAVKSVYLDEKVVVIQFVDGDAATIVTDDPLDVIEHLRDIFIK